MRNFELIRYYRTLVKYIRQLDKQIVELTRLKNKILVLEQQVKDLDTSEETIVLLQDLSNTHNNICLDLQEYRYDRLTIEYKLSKIPVG